MSSPFQKNFSAKSPITTSPLKAGGYASGVDGMRYVSPKQPVSNTPKATKATKATKEKENYLEPAEGVDEMEALINKDKDKRDNILFNAANEKKLPNIGNIEEARVVNKIIPGKKVEKIETDKKKYLKSFEPGFAKDPEGTTNIKDYILKKEGKYKTKTIYQNQKRTGETLDGKLVGNMSEWANVGNEYEKN
mgnify:CR=1 FL=1